MASTSIKEFIGDEIVTGIPADGGARVEMSVLIIPINETSFSTEMHWKHMIHSMLYRSVRDGPDDHMGMEVPESLIFPFLSTTLFGWKIGFKNSTNCHPFWNSSKSMAA